MSRTNAQGLNPWVVMAFIAIPVLIGSFDLTVVSAFLPELLNELDLPFDTGLDDASWVVTSYLLAYTISLTFMGRLSDLFGRRWVYVVCLVIFIIGSVLVAVAHQLPTDLLYDFYRRSGMRPDRADVNLQVLIIARVIEALGAGALVPVSMALVGDLFPPERRARPLGLVAAMDTLGFVLGPVYGALFMQIMPWQGLFWMNVPLTLFSLFLVLYGLRNVPQLRTKGRFDFIGTALIGGALTCLTIGLGGGSSIGGISGNLDDLQPLPDYALPVLGMGAVLFIGFLLVEARVRDPLIKLAMFTRRNLSAAALVNLFVGYVLFIGLVSVPILVNVREGSIDQLAATALPVGLLLSTLTIPMSIAAFAGGWVADKAGLRNTVLLGLGTALVGFALIWLTWDVDIANTVISLQLAVTGIGIGLTFSPISTAIINSAYDDERGVASALVIILRLIGMTISVSSLTSFGIFRLNQLSDAATQAATTASGSLDLNVMTAGVVDAAVQVVSEMGLIGAVLCAIALLPALYMGRMAYPPDEKRAA